VGHRYYYNCPPPCDECWAYFNNAITDSTGSFSIQEYCITYYTELFFQSGQVLMDSIVNIEPDSVNYYEFTLDTLLTGIQTVAIETGIHFSCFPNPSSGETSITFSLPSGRHFSKALIKIYDLDGEIVRILPLDQNASNNNYSVNWDGLCYDNFAASGIYFCKLELDGQKVASDKIVITR
jgi:hypothetical protein